MVNADFTRFCYAAIEATVNSWKDEPTSDGCDKLALWPSSFSSCKTDFDRVCCLMALQPVCDFHLLPASESPACRSGRKSDSHANKLRVQGNQAFRNNEINVALRFYTRALFYASGNEEKALAFGNRSCVLARLKSHTAALEDIEQAFKHGYPIVQQCKLRIRRAQSLLSLNHVIEAQREFLVARDCLPSDSSTTKSTLSNLISVGLRDCETRLSIADWKPTDHPPPLYNRQPGPPIEWNHENPKSVDSDVDRFAICHDNGSAGWHLIAKEFFHPGDLIFLDKPYTRRLHRDCFYNHCYYCFRRSINLIPCRGCAEVGFCSLSCEAEAWKLASNGETSSGRNRPCHRFECGQMQRLSLDDYACWKLLKSKRTASTIPSIMDRFCDRLDQISMDHCIGGSTVSLLSFACVSRTPPHTLATLVQGSANFTTSVSNSSMLSTLLAISGRREFPACGLRANDFSAVGWLTSNSDKRTLHDLWQRTVAAVFLTHCLSVGGYPMDWGVDCLLNPAKCPPLSDESAPPASWIAACLLHLIQAVASNAHTISFSAYIFRHGIPDSSKEVVPKTCGVQLDDVFHSDVGSGLYPLSSMLNHSCNPNVFHVHMADGVFGLYALRVISPNEVLFGNYGYHYALHPLVERQQRLLEQYHFSCSCDACSHNWPKTNLFDRIRCSRCKKLVELKDLVNVTGCGCPSSVQKSVLTNYLDWKNQLEALSTNINSEYSKVSFDQLPQPMLNRHIAQVRRMLGPDAFESIIVRPSFAFDYLQELLKLLLDLRYGCCFSELDGLGRF